MVNMLSEEAAQLSKVNLNNGRTFASSDQGQGFESSHHRWHRETERMEILKKC
jgi:hypothetical protein